MASESSTSGLVICEPEPKRSSRKKELKAAVPNPSVPPEAKPKRGACRPNVKTVANKRLTKPGPARVTRPRPPPGSSVSQAKPSSRPATRATTKAKSSAKEEGPPTFLIWENVSRLPTAGTLRGKQERLLRWLDKIPQPFEGNGRTTRSQTRTGQVTGTGKRIQTK
jgi:hypothetical protein